MQMIDGNLDIFRFYIKTFPYLLAIMKSPIGKEMGPPPEKSLKPFQVELDTKLADNYNKEYQVLNKKFLEANKANQTKFSYKMVSYFILRLMCCVTAYYNNFYL